MTSGNTKCQGEFSLGCVSWLGDIYTYVEQRPAAVSGNDCKSSAKKYSNRAAMYSSIKSN